LRELKIYGDRSIDCISNPSGGKPAAMPPAERYAMLDAIQSVQTDGGHE
jgi:hypothetical protein